MKKVMFAMLLLSSLGAFAQVTQEHLNIQIKPLTRKIKVLQSENGKLKSEIGKLDVKLLIANRNIDFFRIQLQKNNAAIYNTANALAVKIKTTGDKNQGKITEVSKWLCIGMLVIILLLGSLFYWLLSKKQKTERIAVEDQLLQIRKTIEEEHFQMNTKLADLYSAQMELLKIANKGGQNYGELDQSLYHLGTVKLLKTKISVIIGID